MKELKIRYAVRGERGTGIFTFSLISEFELPYLYIPRQSAMSLITVDTIQLFPYFISFTVTRGEKLTDHIIIGTPGTLLDWCIKFRVIDLKKVKVFVLDEADVMIDTQGHQDQSIRIQRYGWFFLQLLLYCSRDNYNETRLIIHLLIRNFHKFIVTT